MLWVASVPPLYPRILAVAAFAVVVGVVLFKRGLQAIAEKRLVENIPCSKARSASIGLAELEGRAVGPYTLTAPVTAQPCFCYRTVVMRRADRNVKWRVTEDRARHVLFYLEDETGRIMVDAEGAELHLPTEYDGEGPMGEITGPPPSYADDDTMPSMGEGWYRVEEACVKPGDNLFVLGTVAENPGLELKEPMDVPLPSLWKMGVGKFLDAVHPPAPAAPAAVGDFEVKPTTIVTKGKAKHFIVSNRSQRELLNEWSWQAVVYTFGGPALALMGMGVIAWQLGLL